ncbi:MAG: pyruvate dehydrogenase (acetyl-transferring) E1 component subunit alpha [Alphaproteobacteria bacterium]|nr:pyruvate dehydrogenase (acetyl-transferring) E1 component subunit alpha [Alphaproteobacteria bacterium]
MATTSRRTTSRAARRPEAVAAAHVPQRPLDLLAAVRDMMLIRLFEQETERQYKRARIGGYCHLAIGQEAATVGAVAALRPEDKLLTSYRSHGFALARGTSPEAVMAELFGRKDGCAAGRGGSMHLLDPARGYLGGWGIVAGQLPIATGVALAAVKRGEKVAVLCELGDGAVNMGAWHEALNLAAIWRLPVVFTVFNNGYGMGTSVEQSSAEPEVYKRAAAFRMPGERVDGQDVEDVYAAADALLSRAREQRQPAVLEVMTYRLRGHSVADAGTAYRTREEVAEWADQRDPIALATAKLLDAGVAQDELDRVAREAQAAVDAAVAFAEASPMPSADTLAEFVYGDPRSGEQFARMAPGAPAGEAAIVAQLQEAS